MKQNLSSRGYDSPQKKLLRLSAIMHCAENQELEICDASLLLKHDISRCAFYFLTLQSNSTKKNPQETLFVLKLIHHSNTNQSINLSFLCVNLFLCEDIEKRHCLRLGLRSCSHELDIVASLIPLEKTSLKYVNR